MNKNMIKLFFVLITVLLSFLTFLSTRYENSTMSVISVLLSLFFAIPFIMQSKTSTINNKKQKVLYKSIMYSLYSISFLIVLFLNLDIITSQTDIFMKFDRFKEVFSNLLFMTTSWLMLSFSFGELEEQTNKTNFVLTIIVSLVIILIHLAYFISPNLKTIINDSQIGEKAIYITQNYIYFGIMYALLLINKLVNQT